MGSYSIKTIYDEPNGVGKMIYTITFNPSLDYFMYMNDSLREGEIVRATHTAMRAGGKGVNVSLLLSNLGISSKAVMFLGKSIGDVIEKQLTKVDGIEVVKVPIEEENRINVKIYNDKETAINAAGPMVGETGQEELLEKLNSLGEGDFVVVSGSYCRGVGFDLVKRIRSLCQEKGARLIADVPGLTLEDCRALKPYLIKPNLEELAQLFHQEIHMGNYRTYADELVKIGVENVLVSLGGEGSYFTSREARYFLRGPEVKVESTVGCGDTMLGCTIAYLSQNYPLEEALKYGEAAGRAKAQIRGIPQKGDINSVYGLVTVNKID